MAWSIGDVLLLADRTVLNPLVAGLAVGAIGLLDPPASWSIPGIRNHTRDSTWLRPFLAIFAFGTLLRVNRFLSRKALNNGVSDTYDWSQEIVVVTGGSGGIGAATAQKFATKGSKVVVIDVLPLTFQPSK